MDQHQPYGSTRPVPAEAVAPATRRDAEEMPQSDNSEVNQPNAPATRDDDRDAEIEPNSEKEFEEHTDAVTRTRDAEDVGDPFADLSEFTLMVGEAIDRFSAGPLLIRTLGCGV